MHEFRTGQYGTHDHPATHGVPQQIDGPLPHGSQEGGEVG